MVQPFSNKEESIKELIRIAQKDPPAESFPWLTEYAPFTKRHLRKYKELVVDVKAKPKYAAQRVVSVAILENKEFPVK